MLKYSCLDPKPKEGKPWLVVAKQRKRQLKRQ
jgi:hypothetical protein